LATAAIDVVVVFFIYKFPSDEKQIAAEAANEIFKKKIIN
jgi:hypothetical protein